MEDHLASVPYSHRLVLRDCGCGRHRVRRRRVPLALPPFAHRRSDDLRCFPRKVDGNFCAFFSKLEMLRLLESGLVMS